MCLNNLQSVGKQLYPGRAPQANLRSRQKLKIPYNYDCSRSAFFSRLTDLNNCAGITVNSGGLSYLPSLNVATQTKVNSFFYIYNEPQKRK